MTGGNWKESHVELAEKYRPKCWDEVIGQEAAVSKIRTLIDRSGAGGTKWFLSGASGVGKTTIAEIIASLVADRWSWIETTGRELSPSRIREIWDMLGMYSLGKGGRALIINEAHGLSGPAIEVLLDALERVPSHAVVIFTTTKVGEAGLFADHDDAAPLLRRCNRVTLTNQGLSRAFAPWLRNIAQLEQLDGLPESEYVKLMARCGNKPSEALNEIAMGAMSRKAAGGAA